MSEELENRHIELVTVVTNSNARMLEQTEQLMELQAKLHTVIEHLGGRSPGTTPPVDTAPVAHGALADVRFNYLRVRSQLGHERATPTTASAVFEQEVLRFEGPAAATARLAIFWIPDPRSPVKALTPHEVVLTSQGGHVTCSLEDVPEEFVGAPCELRDQAGTRVAVVAWPAEVFREV